MKLSRTIQIIFWLQNVFQTLEKAFDSNGCLSLKGKDQVNWTTPGRHDKSGIDNLIEGERWTFDCRTTSNKVNSTLWQKFRNRETQRHPDNKIVTILSKNVFRINSWKKRDRGRYYCETCGTRKYLGGYYFIKGDAYAIPNVTKDPPQNVSPYGGTVTLVCKVYGQYSIRWYKAGSNQSLKSSLTYINNWNKEILTIPNVTGNDDGIYVCEIERKIVQYLANATVTVQSQKPHIPFFTEFNASLMMILKEGKDFHLKYTVFGVPIPNITWFRSRNGMTQELIKECPTTNIENCLENDLGSTITRNSFTILAVKYPVNDNITYSCIAENSQGKAMKSFKIGVHTVPILEKDKPLDYHYFEYGLELNCSVKTVNPTKVNFTWYYCDMNEQACQAKNLTSWHKIAKENSARTTGRDLTSKITLKSLPYKRTKYLCKAENKFGRDHISYKVYGLLDSSAHLDSSLPFILQTAIPVGVISLITLSMIGLVLFKRMRLYGGIYIFSYPPMPDYLKQLDYNKDIREQVQKIPYASEWEFPRQKIKLDSELGKGEFGSVWLAHAHGIAEFCPRDSSNKKTFRFSGFFSSSHRRKSTHVCCKHVSPVAVKKLKDEFDKEKLLDLQAELKILIHVGEHENIVNILGACTKGNCFDLWILLEYCPFGDLRSFLLHGRSHYETNQTSPSVDLSSKFGEQDLKIIAFQIAKGMEFLISRRVIHRDLAARNVLLGDRHVAKISDFGLARDVYRYQKYVKKTSGLLPLKWMAIESIQDIVFTEKSDVWSFGVVLWEIFTLGETPYSGIPNMEILDFLVSGERMPIPTSCSLTMSNLMKQCWKSNPDDRPTFSLLVKLLDTKQNELLRTDVERIAV